MSNEVKIHPQVISSSSISLGKSRQISALARKAYSYQKRQAFTNICCISLCPFIMVIISSALGNLVTNLINSSTTPNEYLYCSNVDNMNSLNIPIWNVTGDVPFPTTVVNSTNIKQFPKSTLGMLYHANWALVRYLSSTGPPGAERASFQRPCVFWFEENYPFSTLYERNPGASASGKNSRDASRLAQPLGGWVNALTLNQSLIDFNTLNIFSQYSDRSYILLDYAPGVDPALIGRKDGIQQYNLVQFANLQNSTVFNSPINSSTGLLGTIPTRYALTSTTGVGTILEVPWYNTSTVGSGLLKLDDAISAQLSDVIVRLAQLDKVDILSNNPAIRNAGLLKASQLLTVLPHGAIYIDKIDHSKFQYGYTTLIGTDLRVSSASNFPPPGRRALLQLTQLNNAILRNSNVSGLGNAQITHGFRIMPSIETTLVKLAFGGIIGVILYPFGISFLLPIFAIVLVQEKEQRILVMMKMNGMKTWAYYLSHYVTFFILYSISALIFTITGAFSGLTFFTITSKSLLFLLFFLWGNNAISLAFFFSSIFNRSRFALVSIFLIVLCSVIISLVIDQLFLTSEAPLVYFFWPPFAFYRYIFILLRALSLINRASYTSTLLPYNNFDQLQPGNEVFTTIVCMAVEIPFFLLLSYYMSAVLPSEFGVQKPWHFPITDLMKMSKSEQLKAEEDMAVAIQIDEKETAFEDEDVKKERSRVTNSSFKAEEYPLFMKNMRKVYAGRGGQGPKLAVKDISFAVEKGIVFGLLGPNGAGKTTLISILTGLYEASSGSATIGGFDIKFNSDEVYKCIGICPQFDIQWEDLTVGEHLYFYARLKGIHKHDERKVVLKSLEDVSLQDFEYRLTKGLSGGERRRLSIAIALLGKPQVVFLDEPTTGLDPEVRRLIWDIVDSTKSDKTVILTTHSMEEAEALCQRIGIMAKGTLRCHADPTRLKKLYGNGFKIFINNNPEDKDRASEFVKSLLPAGYTNVDSFATSTTFEFPAKEGVLPKLFLDVEKGKESHGILDYGIGETSLEEVFIRLISEQDADGGDS